MSLTTRIVAFFLLVLLFSSCKKKPGTGGQKTIYGSVSYKNGSTSTFEKANAAMVHISYGTKNSTSNYDQTIVADEEGSFHFDGLKKGDYFISADYTDQNGFNYSTGGYAITINNKKDKLAVNIELN